jgi:hypothetical protein
LEQKLQKSENKNYKNPRTKKCGSEGTTENDELEKKGKKNVRGGRNKNRVEEQKIREQISLNKETKRYISRNKK